jgi:phospholipid/cholesterol/gamma-HCH transport system permease protein
VYVANLVSIGMVREMAALMTAIIMAGRTGGAYAANAAMQSGEEIDALSAMGIPVFDYLILPRVCFGGFIAVIGCRVGLRADRSAAAVGKAATTAVVIGIVGVIALDAVFDLGASALGV